jgi:hypothetical protein
MNIGAARKWIVNASLGATSVFAVFFVAAPAVEYPGLNQEEAIRLAEIVIPVFMGYLGMATAFAISAAPGQDKQQLPNALLAHLIRWPPIVFGIIVSCAIVAFGFSNRADAAVGTGMGVDQLAHWLTAACGLLAATTGIINTVLFPKAAAGGPQVMSDASPPTAARKEGNSKNGMSSSKAGGGKK